MRPTESKSGEKTAHCRTEKGFVTVERYTDLAGLQFPNRGTVLLECLCNLTANEMFDAAGNRGNPVPTVLEGLERLTDQCENLIVVTNDVGSGSEPHEAGTRDYIRALGEINIAAASRFDAVLELVCGIPLLRKGMLNLPPASKGNTGLTLIIGAAASGKKTYVKSLGYKETDFSADLDSTAPVLTELHTLVNREPEGEEELLRRLCRKEIVVCNEVGGGIIPISERERRFRRETGRLCILLARQAARVVRLVCGIPVVIK